MKRSELKQVLKPLIKECIKEVIFEEGILSNIVSEVVQGLSNKTLVESKRESKQHTVQAAQQSADRQREAKLVRQKRNETRKRMLDAVGADAYNGVDLFEGTTSAPQESKQGDPMAGVGPRDSGVDISKLFGGTSKNWSHLIK